ncbi:MAG: hypothetical protein SD837_22100 [Candidatus Electrothrix scaldis]|nr:MAG: hypothetical protein SD837_22100 [Candidatus Electrothrix sp. GW3-3]
MDKKAFTEATITALETDIKSVIIIKKMRMRLAMVAVCGAVAGTGVVTDEKLVRDRGGHYFFSLG